MSKLLPLLFATLLAISASVRLLSQNPASEPGTETPLDLSTARQLLSDAHYFYAARKYTEAASSAQRAHRFFMQTPDQNQSDLAEAAFQAGRAMANLKLPDSAQVLLLESIATWQRIVPEGSALEALVWAASADNYRKWGRYDEAIADAKKALELQDRFLPENDTTRTMIYELAGKIYGLQGSNEQALPYFEKALKVAREAQGENNGRYAVLLREWSEALFYSGAYERSWEVVGNALAIQQRVLPPNHQEIARTWITLGFFHRHLKENDLALTYFNQAVDLLQKAPKPEEELLAYCYSEMVQTYINLDDTEQALKYMLRSNDIMVQLKRDTHPDYGYTCHDLGRISFKLKKYPEAIEWQKKALFLFQKASKEETADIGSLHLWVGRAQLANGDFQDAIHSFKEDFRILTTFFGPDFSLLYYPESDLGNAYLKWYRKTLDPELLEKSRQYFSSAKKRIEKLLQTATLYSAKRKILGESLDVFEQAIQVELLFHKRFQDGTALERAWGLSELMHGFLLNAAAQEADARHYSGIPDTLLRQDSLLRAEMTQLGKHRQILIEYEHHLLTDSTILAIDLQLSGKRTETLQLQAQFEKEFPEFFRLKYDLKAACIEEAQNLLTPQQTLLEYFCGDSSIFVFVLHQKDIQVIELPKDFPLAKWVASMREGISSYHTAKVKTPDLYKKTVLQYADYSQRLYAKLLAPVAGLLSPELIIIPGDGFSDLPFEALLSGAPKELNNFTTYPFVLRQYSIQYAYSATMLQQMMAKKHRQAPSNDLLAFAPFFEEDSILLSQRLATDEAVRFGFSALPNSGEEVFRAKKRFGGMSKVLIGAAASKQQFLELADKYQVIHLATHGEANHRDGEFSFLAFSGANDTIEHSLLSVGELYNCSLNADMVVLSACETGIGEEQRGEGVVSLARAFAFAGAKSIVSSLWRVNDKSTMTVMADFYLELKAGKPKNVALANAKRHYLAQNPGLMHPFFWAGFVAVGDMSGITK